MKRKFKAPREMNYDRITQLITDLGIGKTVYIQPTVSGELSAAHFEILTERMQTAFTTAMTSTEVNEKLFTWTCQLMSESLQLTAKTFREGKRVTQSHDFLRSFRASHNESSITALKRKCEELRHDMKILVLQFTGRHYPLKARMHALYGVWVTLFAVLDLETLLLERHYGVEATATHAESVQI
jgi:hypothetical protein